MKRALVLFAADLLYALPLSARPSYKNRSSRAPGVGVQIDLGSVIRGLSVLANNPASAPAFAPGQIVAVWELADAQEPAAFAAAIQGQVLASDRLEALALHVALIAVDDERVEASLQLLRDRFPTAVFDRNALVYGC